jgi:hypothetical protein
MKLCIKNRNCSALTYLIWEREKKHLTFSLLLISKLLFISEVVVRVMVFNATLNNISVISLRSVLLLGETRVPKENPRPAARHWQTLSHKVVSSTPRNERDSNSQLLVASVCRLTYIKCYCVSLWNDK